MKRGEKIDEKDPDTFSPFLAGVIDVVKNKHAGEVQTTIS
jgi:hypothetical protein